MSAAIPKQSKYPNNAEQAEWITLTRQGDKTAFAKIVNQYQQSVYNLCYRKLGNTAEAEDASQEIFLRVYAKLASYDDRRQFSSWLFSIATHYCIDRLRLSRPPLVSWDGLNEYFPAESTAQPENILLKTEKSEEIQALLKSLKPDYQGLIMMKYWYALSYQDMAETMGTTVSAIKSKLFRARKMIAQIVSQKQGVAMGSAS